MKTWHKIALAFVLSLVPMGPTLFAPGPPEPGPDFVSSIPSPLVMRTAKRLQSYEAPATDRRQDSRNDRRRKPTRPYIVIDTHTNRLYYRTADSVLFTALCSTGSGAELVDSGSSRRWQFSTPKGVFHINSRLANPWWRKPDWAFIEEGEKLPSNESDRLDPYVLGDYALGFGDGYYIHGTLYERLIGVAVTHGCVRLYGEDIKRLYREAKIGTTVVIY